jgi:hypothetical protein
MTLKALEILPAVLLSAGLAWAQGSQETTPLASDWIQQLQNQAKMAFQDNPNLQSEIYKGKFCIDNMWVQLTITETKVGMNLNIQSTTQNLGDECKPSNDQNGVPLVNDETITTKEWSPIYPPPPPPPPLHEIEMWAKGQNSSGKAEPGPNPVPHAAPYTLSSGFTLLAPFRDVLFTPYYDPSVIPAPPACDPTLSTTSLIVNHGNATVTIVASCSGTQLALVPVTANPLQVALTPDGTMALVTSFDGALTFINMSTYQVAYTLSLTQYFPSGLAISPDGSTAYVTSFDSGTASLLEISIQNPSILNTINLSGYPQSVFLTPDGAQAYITDPIYNSVTVLDLLSGTVSRQFVLYRPIGVAFNAQATQVWISTGFGLVVMDTATYQTIQTIQTDTGGPSDILFTPDNGLVFVNNYFGPSFSIIDPVTFQVQTFPLGGPPMGLTLIQ